MPTVEFQITATANDKLAYRDSSTTEYPPAGGVVHLDTDTGYYASRSLRAGPSYRILNGSAKWVTSSLPDNAVITAVRLRVRALSVSSWALTNSLTMSGDWYVFDGTSTDQSNTPLATAFSDWNPAGRAEGVDYDIGLSDGQNNVSLTGTTGLRLHIAQRAADAAPTGLNEYYFYASDHAAGFPAAPRLIVDYYRPGYGEVRLWARKKGTGSDPQVKVELYETTDLNSLGSLLATPIANTTITSTTGTLLTGDFDQTLIGNKENVALKVVGTGALGGLVEVGSLEWNATIAHDPFVTVVSSPITFY